METNLNVMVKVAGEQELNDLIDKVKSGTASIEDHERLIKRATKVYKGWRGENDSLKKGLADTIRVAKDSKDKAMKPLEGAAGKLKREYFELGHELRQFYKDQRIGDRTMKEGVNTFKVFGDMLGMGGLTGTIGTAVDGFQQMEFAVTAVGLSGQAAGGKMANLGATLASLAGPLAAGAAALGVMYMAFQHSAEMAKEFDDAIKGLYESEVALGKVTKQQQIANLAKQIEVLQKAPLEGPGLFDEIRGAIPGTAAYYELIRAKQAAQMKRQADINKLMEKQKELEKDIAEEGKKKEETKKKSDEEAKKKAEEAVKKAQEAEEKKQREVELTAQLTGNYAKLVEYLDKRVAGEKDIVKSLELQIARDAALTKQRQAEAKKLEGRAITGDQKSAAELFGVKLPEKGKKANEPPMKLETVATTTLPKVADSAKMTFEEMMTASDAFSQSLQAGLGSVSSMIGTEVGGAFADMFGGAETLAGQFFGSMMSNLAEMAAQIALSFIPGGSLLSGLFKASGGPVTQAHPYVVGERGPEIFVPNRSGNIVSNAKAARFGGESARSNEPIVLSTRVRGNDLVLVQNRAGRNTNGRLM